MDRYYQKKLLFLMSLAVTLLLLSSLFFNHVVLAQDPFTFYFSRHKPEPKSDSQIPPTKDKEQNPTKPELSKQEKARILEIWKAKGYNVNPTGVVISEGKRYVGWNKTVRINPEDGGEKKTVTVVSDSQVKDEWFPEYYSDKETPFGRSLIYPQQTPPELKVIFIGISHEENNPDQRTDVEDAAYILSLQAKNPEIKIIAYYEELPQGKITSLDEDISGTVKSEMIKREILQNREYTWPSQIGSIELLMRHGVEVMGLENNLSPESLNKLSSVGMSRIGIEHMVNPTLIEYSNIRNTLKTLIYLEYAGGKPVEMKIAKKEETHQMKTVDAISWLQQRAMKLERIGREGNWLYHMEPRIAKNPKTLHVIFAGDGHIRDLAGTNSALYKGIEAIEKEYTMKLPFAVFGLDKDMQKEYLNLKHSTGYIPNFENPWFIDHYRNFYELASGPDPYASDYLGAYGRHLDEFGQAYNFPHPKDYQSLSDFGWEWGTGKAGKFYWDKDGWVHTGTGKCFTDLSYPIFHETIYSFWKDILKPNNNKIPFSLFRYTENHGLEGDL